MVMRERVLVVIKFPFDNVTMCIYIIYHIIALCMGGEVNDHDIKASKYKYQ
jgi:hypothetical protein